MKNIPLLLATLLGTFVTIFGVAFLFSNMSAPKVIDASAVVEGARHFFTSSDLPSTEPTEEATDAASVDTQQTIQVVEFSDFQCPACRAAEPIKDELMTSYPGQIEFIYRHYPLTTIHPNAMLASQAAEAAGKMEKFWPMHDLLFDNQDAWSDLSNDEARATFIEYATQLELNAEEFVKLLDDSEVKQLVQTDINSGNALRISSTPTFFVNGQKVTAPEVIPTVEGLLNQ